MIPELVSWSQKDKSWRSSSAMVSLRPARVTWVFVSEEKKTKQNLHTQTYTHTHSREKKNTSHFTETESQKNYLINLTTLANQEYK